MLRKGFVGAVTLAFGFSWASQGSVPSTGWVVELDSGKGKVEFSAVGRPSALKIHGQGSGPKGRLMVMDGAVSGEALFDLSTLDTGIKLRNEHMRKKYLEVEKFPEAKLTLNAVKLPASIDDEKASFDRVPFEGKLLLHGQEKPVSGTVQVDRNKGEIKFVADFGLKISDFGISRPGFAGVTMAEDVKVAVEVLAPLTRKQ